MRYLLTLVIGLFTGAIIVHADDLIINAADLGVAKFHRQDNKIHPHDEHNQWASFILPDGVEYNNIPLTRKFRNEYSVYFNTLEQLVKESVRVAKITNKKIRVLNINTHGLPGGSWFPRDQEQLNSPECKGWRKMVSSSDVNNYNQYYSSIPKSAIMMVRKMSESTTAEYECTTGLKGWTDVVNKNKDFIKYLADDVQIRFLSCNVGLGRAGEYFTEGLVKLLFKDQRSHIQTTFNFGLGDWSMPEGMGFWDYKNDEQLEQDNKIYVENKRDRDMAQVGTIRTSFLFDNKPVYNMDKELFMPLDFIHNWKSKMIKIRSNTYTNKGSVPEEIQIIGTKFILRKK